MKEVEKTDNCLHGNFEDGQAKFGIYISTDDSFSEMIKFHQSLIIGDEFAIFFKFSLSECLDDLIEYFKLNVPGSTTIDKSDKKNFENLKNELLSMIKKIDSLDYK